MIVGLACAWLFAFFILFLNPSEAVLRHKVGKLPSDNLSYKLVPFAFGLLIDNDALAVLGCAHALKEFANLLKGCLAQVEWGPIRELEFLQVVLLEVRGLHGELVVLEGLEEGSLEGFDHAAVPFELGQVVFLFFLLISGVFLGSLGLLLIVILLNL